MKNPDEKVNIGAVEAKTLYLWRVGGGGEGGYSPIRNLTEIKYIIQRFILSNNDMI